jgi:LacI family repressor for deo operon, udp, cdd, tsx, nupC, and nupG
MKTNESKITIKQIASMTGVSIATVSRVMNHKTNVKRDTQQKILEILEKLNINPSSILLTDNTSRAILLCVSELQNPFNGVIINGIRQAAYQNNYRVFILQSKEVYFTLEDFKDVLQNHSFAGILLLASVANTELLEQLTRSCPTVMCSEYCDVNGISFVSIDDLTAARRATSYLAACGCKKIALINSNLRHQFARHREQGYLEALGEAGLEKNANWIAHISSVDYTSALPYAMNILSSPNRPDGVFAISDVFAVAAIHAAKRLGLRIPEDVSIIGFDNVAVSSMTDPPITTIEQPGIQIGYQALELLIEKINNPTIGKKQIILETELIVRESTAQSPHLPGQFR